MSVILETKQLCKFYGTGENQVKAVNQVDIQIEQGEFVAIVGKSGSGKSTLLHMLGGLDTPTKGSVTLAGKDLYRMKEPASPFIPAPDAPISSGCMPPILSDCTAPLSASPDCSK